MCRGRTNRISNGEETSEALGGASSKGPTVLPARRGVILRWGEYRTAIATMGAPTVQKVSVGAVIFWHRFCP